MRYLSRCIITVLIVFGAFLLFNQLANAQQQAEVIRAGDCTLGDGHGYFVEGRAVVDIQKSPYDFTVVYSINHNRHLIYSAKVKSLGRKRPDLGKLDLTKVDKWKSSAFIPSSGFYYLVKGVHSGKLFLIYVNEISGDSYTATINLKWEELSIRSSEKVLDSNKTAVTPKETTDTTATTIAPTEETVIKTPKEQGMDGVDTKKTKFCRYCGERIVRDGRFCEFCGGDFQKESEPSKIKFCRYCGEKIVNYGKYCESCGKEIDGKPANATETDDKDAE